MVAAPRASTNVKTGNLSRRISRKIRIFCLICTVSVTPFNLAALCLWP
jgi:hypothetical protein